jgi:hypothetical protein
MVENLAAISEETKDEVERLAMHLGKKSWGDSLDCLRLALLESCWMFWVWLLAFIFLYIFF